MGMLTSCADSIATMKRFSDDAHICQQHCLQVYIIGLSIMSVSGVHTIET